MAVFALEPENMTWGELALTHPVCYHTQAIPLTGWVRLERESPQSEYWNRMLGGEGMLWGMHHYCWALINLHRAQAAGISTRDRDFLISSTIGDFRYVIRWANRLRDPASFRMLPELYFRLAESHAMLEQTAPALEAYEMARRVKRDYWPPYVGQAKLLEKAGMRGDALRLLEDGLRVMPGEPNLAALYARLGGKSAPVRPAPAAASASVVPDVAGSAAR